MRGGGRKQRAVEGGGSRFRGSVARWAARTLNAGKPCAKFFDRTVRRRYEACDCLPGCREPQGQATRPSKFLALGARLVSCWAERHFRRIRGIVICPCLTAHCEQTFPAPDATEGGFPVQNLIRLTAAHQESESRKCCPPSVSVARSGYSPVRKESCQSSRAN